MCGHVFLVPSFRPGDKRIKIARPSVDQPQYHMLVAIFGPSTSLAWSSRLLLFLAQVAFERLFIGIVAHQNSTCVTHRMIPYFMTERANHGNVIESLNMWRTVQVTVGRHTSSLSTSPPWG